MIHDFVNWKKLPNRWILLVLSCVLGAERTLDTRREVARGEAETSRRVRWKWAD